MTGILRRLPTDDDRIKKRLEVLERWIANGRIEPWRAVLVAEWGRTPQGRNGQVPTEEEYEDLFDGPTLEAMREQADGPWMIHADQARGERAHRHVTHFLDELDVALAEKNR